MVPNTFFLFIARYVNLFFDFGNKLAHALGSEMTFLSTLESPTLRDFLSFIWSVSVHKAA